jgi:hypothetical protein
LVRQVARQLGLKGLVRNLEDTKVDPNYKPAWKPYGEFEIDYGIEELLTIDRMALEDHEFGKLYFIGFRGEMKGFRDELKGFRQDTNVSFKEMTEKIRGYIE